MEVKELTAFFKKWRNLVKQAENGSRMEERTEQPAIEITVAKVLAAGDFVFGINGAVIVKDIENKIWIVPETQEKGGLVNRNNVKPGMKIKLVITETVFTGKETRAFPQ